MSTDPNATTSTAANPHYYRRNGLNWDAIREDYNKRATPLERGLVDGVEVPVQERRTLRKKTAASAVPSQRKTIRKKTEQKTKMTRDDKGDLKVSRK